MKLFEHMGKELFKYYGIPVPRGDVAFTPEKAAELAGELGEVVIKSQVLTGKRGKAGAISFAATPAEAYHEASRILQMELGGQQVTSVLVEEKIHIQAELYLAVTVDTEARQPVILASRFGGMDVEEVPPEDMITWHVDVVEGFYPYIAREICGRMGLEAGITRKFAGLLESLYRLFSVMDAELVEINPLVISGENLIAVDSKVTIDDDALYRHPDLPRVQEKTSLEEKAHQLGLAYVDLGGDIAVMANGAGITMATLDLVKQYGGEPANFLDFGGGAGEEKTTQALELLLATDPRVMLINIFGGITRCDVVARGFAAVNKKNPVSVPVFFRLVGTNEEEGRKILKDAGFEAYESMDEVVRRAAQHSREQ